MPTFRLTIAYDGTGFVGWQRQASGTSIQGLLEDALGALDGREVVVTGAGRTDAGVHAIGQVAGVSLERAIDGPTLARAVNARLPEAVRVTDASEAPPAFHARFNARSKTYRYRIWNREVLSPFERAYAWHVAAPPLDVEAMAAAALVLEGRHDFAAFQAAGSDTRTTERTVLSSRVSRGPEAPLITCEISGNGFLRHMVRNIAGTLGEVGRGHHPVAWVEEVLASRERARAGPTAPPEGLFLVRVDYE
jgi:tRNA pseudouridine38-40 synthase